MPLAVIRHGVIQPIEPLPADWQDGTELIVERSVHSPSNSSKDRADEWMDEVEAVAQSRAAHHRTDLHPRIGAAIAIGIDIDGAGARFRIGGDDLAVEPDNQRPGR